MYKTLVLLPQLNVVPLLVKTLYTILQEEEDDIATVQALKRAGYKGVFLYSMWYIRRNPKRMKTDAAGEKD